MKVIVGNAWPYANGSLHIGRISSWIAGDVIARYHRLNGDDVIFISGSDCHGTPILNKAKEMDKSPKAVSSYFHREFKRTFELLNFSFDIFSKTDSEHHKNKVQQFILKLYENGFIYSKEVDEYYCMNCKEVIGDRSIIGICPYCHKKTTGEQCDSCSKLIEPEQLENKSCIICGKKPILRKNNQLFFKLSVFEDYIKSLTEKENGWRRNAKELTERYLSEGLRDRSLSRDIDWGIDVPIEGFKDKKIYVWIEAVLAYLTASMEYLENDTKINEYWNNIDSRIYLVHGKENIPFHSIILPSILRGIGLENNNIRIISSEYMNLEGKKFSSNRNWVVWANYLALNYDESLIRYYLLKNGAEEKISNFSWKEFIRINNNELLGIYGNFFNRIVTFINRYYNNKFEINNLNREIKDLVDSSYDILGNEIELGNIKKALDKIIDVVKIADKYFEEEKPWILLKSNEEHCNEIIGTCLYVILNLSNFLEPFIPLTAEKIRKTFNIERNSWRPVDIRDIELKEIKFLFEKIDFNSAKEEIYNLKNNKN